jgi:hypothetical protein
MMSLTRTTLWDRIRRLPSIFQVSKDTVDNV